MEIVVAEEINLTPNQKSKGTAPRGPLIEPNKVVEAPKELNLPDGWTYEEVPRTNPKYFGKIDKYYYEPGTSMKFRTYQSVLRHLQSKRAEQGSEQTKLANGMQFKSAIAAKRAARKIVKNEKNGKNDNGENNDDGKNNENDGNNKD